MNVAEKVATLEALLQKVHRNAALPRTRSQDFAGGALLNSAGVRATSTPEPSFDDVISAIEAHSPEGFPAAGKAPKLTALAPPLTGAGAQPKQPATPAAGAAPPAKPEVPTVVAPAAGVAKVPVAPAARPATPPAGAKTQPAAVAKAPGAPPPRAPAPSRPETGAKLFEVDDLEDNLDAPPAPVEKPPAKLPGLFDLPRVTTSPDYESEVSFADVLPDDPSAAPGRALPVAPPNRAADKPVDQAAALRAKPVDIAPIIPISDATRPATPTAAVSNLSGDAHHDAIDTKEPPPTPRREVDVTPAGRPGLEVVDDEPTVVRTGLEEELAAATRKPGLEDEETAVPSSRSHARVIASSVEEEKTTDAPSVEIAAAALRTEAADGKKTDGKSPTHATKPAEKPAGEVKPSQKQPEAQRASEEEPTEIGRRRPGMGTESKPQPGKKSPSLLLLAVAACALAGAAAYWGFSKYGGHPDPVPPSPNQPSSTPTLKPAETTGQQPPSSPSASAVNDGAPTAAPIDTAAPAASVEPTASAASAAPPPDASTLPATKGYLVVNSPQQASVYVNGVFSGNTGEPLTVLCGTRNVRLGKLTTDASAVPEWVAPGQPAIIACKATTTVSFSPGASPPPSPGGGAPGGAAPGSATPGGTPPGGTPPGDTPPGGTPPGDTPPGGAAPSGTPPPSPRQGGDGEPYP
ncbi:hypothetical protein [Chondromyces apiculatus]|uniref:hypothetical protein n=1 Tax=Chondromyces apiculatus TaxID=51 RepID=UPI0012DE68FC|nr:hypothetical protein [Chondromyces apiculatus]